MSNNATQNQRVEKASRKRRAEKKAETRRAILDAATEIFLAQGKDDFSLRQVAEATGYSATTIYLYFEDKEDLLLHAALDGFVIFGQALRDAYDAHDAPWERLMAEGEAYVRFGLSYPVHYRLMFMGYGGYLDCELPEGHPPVRDSFQILSKTVQECIDAGIMPERPLEHYTTLIWSGVHGVVSLCLANPMLTKEDALAAFKLHEETMMLALKT